MEKSLRLRCVVAMVVLGLSSLACGLNQGRPTPTRTPAARVVPTKTRTPEPTDMPMPTNTAENEGELIHHWASTGEASSEYGSLSWSALQIGGTPDSLDCGDATSAWASAESNSVESITAYFMEEPLIPTKINIVENYNPSQVVKVELIDAYAEHSDAVIYEAEPKVTSECPYTLSMPVTGVDYPVMGVRITIDQSVLGLGWNEIDAVEMVGYSETGYQQQPIGAYQSKGIWENVYALPIYPSVDYADYPSEQTLMFSVSSNSRLDVLGYILTELDGIGWLLDVDENGNCRDETRCTSKYDGVDYSDPENDLWFFIPPESSSAYLMLILSEESGTVYVTMNLQY
jgi:hypothetical protein